MSISNTSALVGAALLSGGMAMAGFFVSHTLYNAKVAVNTAEVKGLSMRRVEADLAYWNVGVTVSTGGNESRVSLFEKTEAQQQDVVEALKQEGFQPDEIELGTITYSVSNLRNEKNEVIETTQEMYTSVRVETPKVRTVKKARGALNQLVAQGIDLTNEAPTYLFTSLNDIKPAMLQEATQNARVAATQFAEDAGVKVGGIRSARQGAFSIVDVGFSYGDTRKLEKEIRVVTNIEFYLTE